MKISDLLPHLECEQIFVEYGGYTREIDKNDPLTVAAYGDFLVDKVRFSRTDGKIQIEISVLTRFVKGAA